MNNPYSTDREPLDPAALAEFNAGTAKAIRANKDRKTREKFLDALYIYNEPAR